MKTYVHFWERSDLETTRRNTKSDATHHAHLTMWGDLRSATHPAHAKVIELRQL
jgi:hypothetical protein